MPIVVVRYPHGLARYCAARHACRVRSLPDPDVLAVMRRTYLLEVVPPAALESLIPFSVPRSYQRGEHVYSVGDVATHLPVVAEGRLKHSIPTQDGDELVLEVVQVGGICGEPGLFAREGIRIADLVALEPSVVIGIEKAGLIEFLARHPPAMLRMLEGLAEQVRSTVEDLAAIAFQNIRGRLALKLLELVGMYGSTSSSGVRIDMNLSQTTLAGMIGATRENVNRALRSLSDSGHVTVSGTRIVVPDVEALRAVAGGGHLTTYRRNISRPNDVAK